MAPNIDVDKFKDAARRFSGGFTSGQKAMTGIAVLAVVIGAVMFAKVAGRPSYQPLFTGLQAADAGAITTQLKSAKVPYQLADGGSTVLVPASQVYQERVSLAQAGLPNAGTVGLSIMDKEGLTTSSLTQQADYQRAIQGQLDSTIASIQGVTSAQVNLVMPPSDVFAVSNNQTASASVLVNLTPGAVLRQNQVQAIVHLVASAVANLSPNDVTVVDSSGTMLAGPGVTAGGGEDSQTAAYDSTLAASIDSMLAKVVGPGKADAQVNAQLDLSQVQTTTKALQVGPNGAPVSTPTSTSTDNENFNGSTSSASGVLGALPSAAAGASGPNSTYTKQTSDSTFATGEVDQTVTQAPGSVKRLSVAVLVDSSAKGVSDASLTQLVSAAAGIQPSRGDTLSVVRMPFSNAASSDAKAAAAAAAAAQRGAQMTNLIKSVVPAIVVLVALALLIRVLRRPRSYALPSAPGTLALEAGSDTSVGDLVAGATSGITAAPMAAELSPMAVGSHPAGVEEFIEQQPDQVARLLRSWMSDRVGSDA
ncbi:MAG TPA: flagellar basal-body MS-ring/collar protein FliF [Acidimicrobiales bacterium]|nr:flagellar basal-body MS-ring/collar protein FliF [Acidimicrobiales bacterium]